MSADRTFVTELATGLGMVGGLGDGAADLGAALAARPAELANLTDDEWARLDELWAAGDHRADFEHGLANGRAFLAAPDALNGRPPRIVEWTGPRRAPGDEVVPADLRVDHVYLVSCKYLSMVLHNSSPQRLVEGLLSRGALEERGDWYRTVAPAEHRELYAACRAAREMLTGPHAVGRVIARPFEGAPGDYRRTTNRHDFSLVPFEPSVMDRLVEHGHRVMTVGKVDDLFAGHGVTDGIHTKSNDEGQAVLLDLASKPGEGLVFANLVDFDTMYGHRNDPRGFAGALERCDEGLGQLIARLRDDEMVLITADHGNDPTTPSTDHSREYTPLLVAGPRVRQGADLGTRTSFADLGATIAEIFGVTAPRAGRSFLKELRA